MQSLKELYRIGLGPSSSHTMAPNRAAHIFLKKTPQAASYQVSLYGSLAATGRGHFTDRAITCVLGAERTTIHWKPSVSLPFHPNGMRFQALDSQENVIQDWTVYSVGGGALQEEGKLRETPPIYPVSNFAEAIAWSQKEGKPLWQLVPEYEGEQIWTFLETVWEQMKETIKNGLKCEDVLPGGLKLSRRAKSVYRKTIFQKEERTGTIAAYALATSEENAACGTVVAAPTCGSCGILPAVLQYLEKSLHCSDKEIYCALAVAGIVGNIVKHNGSISGAEVGCQGEVGVACAMAAGAAAQLLGGTTSQIEYAAEMGLEHFLGLTCDPVKGLVQIPCIERNVLAANKAMIAAEYALLTDGLHRISFDQVVKAMLQTGHDLPRLYRETSTGGLAIVSE